MKETTKETLKELGFNTLAFISAFIFIVLILLVTSFLIDIACPCYDTCTGYCGIDQWYCTSPTLPATAFVILLIIIYKLIGRMKE